MNPFQPLYDQCNQGNAGEKHALLPDFPRMMDIELTSSCNFRCLMCPTGNLSLKRKATFMTWPVLVKIVDQCEPGTGLRFIGWGEPTLHPQLVPLIRQCSERGLFSHINTNGSKIDKKLADQLVQAGLSSIKFSFQGVDSESYAEMRNTYFFEGMIEAIKLMRRARGGNGSPFIAASTSVTYESRYRIGVFRERLEPLVDQLSIGKTIFDFMDMKAVRLKPEERERLLRLKSMASDEKAHPDPCPEVWDKLSIHADGSVVVCCNDVDGVVTLGNIKDTPISELWRHPKIEAYRERLSRSDYEAPLCNTCYDYQGLSA